MKKQLKISGIIALVMLIGFSMMACPVEDPDLTGRITISPAGPVDIGTELTATYSGDETVSYQWKNGATNVGTDSNKYTPEMAGSYTVTVSAEGFKSKTSAAVTVTGPTDDWKTGVVWLKTKESKYDIDEDEGTVGEVKSETTTEWSIYKYANNKKYEQKYKTTNTTGNSTTYTNRDGLNSEEALDYSFTFSGSLIEGKSKSKKVYDTDTGLMVVKSTPVNEDGTEGTPEEYTIELLSDSNGIKTYKNTQGNFVYTNKIQNGRIIEQKVEIGTYSSYTNVYTFPTNEVIRAKLPDFTLVTMTGDGNVYGNEYQEVELVSDSDSVLVIRVKTFSKSNWGVNPQFELSEQSDFTYTKFTFPMEPSGE